MPLGKPAILDPRSFDIRAFQGSVKNIRERIEFIEQSVTAAVTQANSVTAATPVATLQQQIQQLGAGFTQLTNALNDLTALTSGAVAFVTMFNALQNGIVVKIGSGLAVSRSMVEGPNIAINYPDGVDAAPVISYEPTGTVLPLAGGVALQGYPPAITIGP